MLLEIAPVLSLREAAELLGHQGNRARRSALRQLRRLEASLGRPLVHRSGEGRRARYQIDGVGLAAALGTSHEELARVRRDVTQLRVRITSVGEALDELRLELAAVRIALDRARSPRRAA